MVFRFLFKKYPKVAQVVWVPRQLRRRKWGAPRRQHPKMAQENFMLQVMRSRAGKKLHFGFLDPALVGWVRGDLGCASSYPKGRSEAQQGVPEALPRCFQKSTEVLLLQEDTAASSFTRLIFNTRVDGHWFWKGWTYPASQKPARNPSAVTSLKVPLKNNNPGLQKKQREAD